MEWGAHAQQAHLGLEHARYAQWQEAAAAAAAQQPQPPPPPQPQPQQPQEKEQAAAGDGSAASAPPPAADGTGGYTANNTAVATGGAAPAEAPPWGAAVQEQERVVALPEALPEAERPLAPAVESRRVV